MNTISEDIKKIMLAGIGAVATTAEKSKDVIDCLLYTSRHSRSSVR